MPRACGARLGCCALCSMAPELAGWAWSIPGACLRQLVSHYEMSQNREFGAKELKWEGEF